MHPKHAEGRRQDSTGAVLFPLPFDITAGRDYSGKFVVRVGKDLYRELAIHALREGVSLNSYCARVLREGRAAYGSRSAPSEKR